MRKIYMFLFCIIINLHAILNNAFTQIPSYVPTDSLKAWYPFNGNANDISGNSMNGSLYGTTLAFVPGLFNQAVQFNNVNHTSWFDVNDYISFPNFNLNNYSVSFWVKFHSNAGWQNHSCYPFSLGDMSCNGSQGIGIETDGTLRSDLNSTTGSSSYKIIDTLNIDMWYNITTVINYSKLYFYVNGSLADTITINANHNFNNHPIYLAMHHWYCNGTSSSRFNGQIDNFGIWNRPLASCEVYQLYSGIIQSNPTVNLGNDTTLNQGSSLNLNAGNTGSTYLWSTGSTSQTINVSTAGAYWVKVTNSGGCYSSDTINVSFLTSTIPLNDTTICKGESITFTASAPTSGSWQYFQDFENTIGNEWSDTNRFSFNSTKVLGPYGNQTANLNLNSLPAHDSVEISFDLYIHDTWDGNSVANGPDIWILKVNNDTLINATFTNNPGQVQSFPQNVPASNPLKTGALITNLPVLCSSWVGSSMYKISKKIPNNSNSLNISFKGGADQNACDESWSIDNVKVKLLNVNTTTQYFWSNGATTPSINVSPNQTTTYTVIVTNGSAVFKDTATVYVLNPQINIGQDTTICKGESVVLTANASSQNICNKSQLPANLQQGLVAYYPFCGNANDESGNGNNGTVNGVTLTTDRFGNANSAYSFNGLSNIVCPSTGMLNNQFTYSLWVNTAMIPVLSATSPISIGDNCADQALQLNTINQPCGWSFISYISCTPSTTGCNINSCPTINSWYNITLTRDSSLHKIFINGVLVASLTTNSTNPSYGNIPVLAIGSRADNVQKFNGKIDDVNIYNRALSANEIQQLFTLGTTSTSSFLWSTNDTTQSITITPNQTTTYTLTVTNGNISCMDTITINVLNPQINNGQDTTICKGEMVVLSAQNSSQNACNKTQLPANLQQGLVAYYPFCGNANDESGNGNNGTVNGATLTTDRFGNANRAYSFDGLNHEIDINPSNLTNFPLSNSERTISAWIKLKTGGCLFYYGDDQVAALGNAPGTGIGIYVFNNQINYDCYYIWGMINNVLDTSQWYLVSYTYAGGNIIKNYINGQYIGDAVLNGVLATCTVGHISIGTKFDSYNAYQWPFNGKIDELTVYDRVLSPLEINQLYNFGSTSNTSTYYWSTNDTTQSIIVTPNQTTTYTLTATNGNISCMDTITVNVLNPQINLGNDTTICQGQSKTLSVGSGYSSYLWSTGATTQQITLQNTGTYWVKAISNQGCTVRDTINLTFLPVQSNILRDSILCLGQSLIFNPGAGYSNHLWSTGATTASLNVNQPSIIWLQVKQPNGCVIKDTAIVKYDSLNIVISLFSNPTCYGGNNGSVNTTTSGLYPPFTYSWNTLPVQTTQNISNLIAGTYTVTLTDSLGCKKTASKTLTAPNPLIVSLGNDTNICQGQNLTLQATQTFASYLWSTGASTQSITVNSSGTYWLKGTDATGCSGSDTIIVTVNPKPIVSIAPLSPSICKGDSIILTASSNIASTAFIWSNGGNTNTINVSPAITTTYSVIGTKNSCKDTASVILIVNPIPIVSITPSNPSICKGDTITLTATSNLPSTTYIWNNAATTSFIKINPTVNSSYYVIGKLNQCVDTAFVNLTVKPLPIITVSANKNPICEGESANLTATSNMPSTTYLWNNSSTSNPLTVSPLISTYYFVKGTASNCHDTAGINIVVISKQTVNLGNDRYLCAGDEINLTANNLTGTYLWSNGSNSSIITVSEPGVYWLRVDNNGCIASDTIEMKKCSEIWVPNVFTPNDDGINDLFHAVTTEIQKLTMYIYNRWGEMIFETSDINGGWNGKINGNDAPSAVYYWLIKYYENRSLAQNIEKELHGSVTLLR